MMESGSVGLFDGQPSSFATQQRMAVFAAETAIPVALERAAGIAQMTPVRHALSRLLGETDMPPADSMWCILPEDTGYEALGVIERRIEDSACPFVLQVCGDAIDPVWAMFGEHHGVVITIDPDEAACALALAQTRRVGQPHVANSVDDHRLRQIDMLQEEVQRISRMLAHLAVGDGGAALFSSDHSREPASPFIDDYVLSPSRSIGAQPPHATVGPRDVRRIIRQRRLREELFPADMFADPAWDMLLDLYAAKLDRARVSVSSLCIAAAVPATTALRWIKTLTETGIFRREADQLDGRRIFVALSDQATDAMHRYFARAAEV